MVEHKNEYPLFLIDDTGDLQAKEVPGNADTWAEQFQDQQQNGAAWANDFQHQNLEDAWQERQVGPAHDSRISVLPTLPPFLAYLPEGIGPPRVGSIS